MTPSIRRNAGNKRTKQLSIAHGHQQTITTQEELSR
jgi:hypothetical protein